MAKRITDEDLRLNLIINGDGGKKEMLELERQMKDFSYREFEASPTAECEGICNVITSFAVRDAVKELTERVLQPLRDKVGHPLRINSGYRCPELNRMVGGVPTSQHVKGEAADIAAADPFLLAKVVRNTPEIWKEVDQMILYPTFVQGKLCDVLDNVFREDARRNQPRTLHRAPLPLSPLIIEHLRSKDNPSRIWSHTAVALSRVVISAYHWFAVYYVGLAAFFIQVFQHLQLL